MAQINGNTGFFLWHHFICTVYGRVVHFIRFVAIRAEAPFPNRKTASIDFGDNFMEPSGVTTHK
jgi:hypothetical protein